VKLRWTPLAVSHLEAAHQYLSQENRDAADKAIEQILSGVERLETHPEMGRKGRVPETRELVITGSPFIVAYRLHKESIEILSVLHGARKWPTRF
jgi:toxin ParE1/3/4